MKKLSVLAISFIIFAFTPPSIGWTPVSGINNSLKLHTAASHTKVSSLNTTEAAISPEEILEEYIEDTFDEMDLRGTGLKRELFSKAVIGLQNFKKANIIPEHRSIISIIDFGKDSHQKRLWVIDLKSKKLLYQTLVAHGRGSGLNRAQIFSDNINSFQSSLGFYVTANTYMGKHGLSLKLKGLEAKYNKNAYARAIVVHGADYVSKEFIKANGYLGRSHGCPALPHELTGPIIQLIKNKTLLYIDGNVSSYTSTYLNKNIAAAYFVRDANTLTASR